MAIDIMVNERGTEQPDGAAARPRPRRKTVRRRRDGGAAATGEASAAKTAEQVDVAEVATTRLAPAVEGGSGVKPRGGRSRRGSGRGRKPSDAPPTPALASAPSVPDAPAAVGETVQPAAERFEAPPVERMTPSPSPVVIVDPRRTHPAPPIDDAAAQAQRRRSRRGRRGRRGRHGRENEEPVRAPALDESVDRRLEEAVEHVDDAEGVERDAMVLDIAERDRDLDVEPDVEAESDVDFDAAAPPARGGPDGRREMVINVSAGHECRIAILNEGRLEELFIEREATQSHVGNIYKGRITNVEASIQAVFVDFGLPKNGFLHISDVQPQYFPNHAGATEDVGRKIPRHHRPPIQKCFRRGQEVIVQITKEGVGTKGPTLSSYLSIPGRFLVMMPGMSRHGVSRKIEDETARRQMRDLLNELKLPSGMGFILRTAGLDRSKRDLQRDLNYLLRLWKTVVERIKTQPAPAELYRESNLVTRTIRDVYSTDFDRLIVDDEATARQVREFLQIAMPRTKTVVELYTEREPLFHRMGIEAEIERINMRHVPLKSGGSLVIDSTEALVAIDVNSGRFRSPDDAEETALRINVEAAEEIARQLRLRDLGGLIVCDFIDMRHDRNKRKVEQTLKDALKKHKERARITRMSAFGLIEMTRQRQGPSILRSLYADCAHCKGTGHVKMPESVILDVMRIIQLAMHHQHVQKVIVTTAGDIAYQLLNSKRAVVSRIESETGKTVVIRGDAGFTSDQVECVCEDARGRQVPIGASGSPPPAR